MKRRKITIIGAGNVGATLCQRVLEQNMADAVLIDIEEGIAAGKALDLMESSPLQGFDVKALGGNNYAKSSGSDIVVITAGIARKPGMDREELFKINAAIVKEVTEKAVAQSPDAILVIVSNPLDAMAYMAYRVSGFPRSRVIGMAGALDAARLASFIAMELDVSVENIQPCVFGGHGDTMVPSINYTTVAGVPVKDLIEQPVLEKILDRTRSGGAEIVGLLKTGSAYYAPSAAVMDMLEAIIMDKKKIIPCSVLTEGEYGFNHQFLGVPVKLGLSGAEDILEFSLSDSEYEALKISAGKVNSLCRDIDALL